LRYMDSQFIDGGTSSAARPYFVPRKAAVMLRVASLGAIALPACSCGKPPHDAPPASSTTSDAASGSSPGVPTKSTTSVISGTLRQNKYLKLAVTEAGFADPPDRKAPSGQRYYTVGLRGASRSRSDVAIGIQQFVFAQNERGCISRPEPNPAWLEHPFRDAMTFTAAQMTDGELAFPVPDDSKSIRVLIAPAEGEGLIVPAGRDFTPTWPDPVSRIEDGSTLRVLVLPRPALPASLAAPPAGRTRVVLDFVVQNLKSTQGVEFQTSQQLRLKSLTGSYVQAAGVTSELGCRLDDGDVIPPGHSRRFMVVYDMPAAAPLKLDYRGFEVDEVSVDLQ
jgi:hypothetical protein